MRKSTIIFFLTVLLFSCDKQVKEKPLSVNKSDLLGMWSNDEYFLVFKDSVSLPFDFYLYSNWKLDSNKIQIYNIESRPEEDSLWINYLITSFSKDSLTLISPVFNSDSNEVTLYREKMNIQNKVDHIKLIRPIYPGEESIVEIKVEGNGEVSFKEVTKANDTLISTCSLDNNEMDILNSMINQIEFSEIDSMYISGLSDQDYYSLEISTITTKDTLKVTVDTGYVSPNIISRIITFIWANTKLKCTPDRYNDWRMYYNPM